MNITQEIIGTNIVLYKLVRFFICSLRFQKILNRLIESHRSPDGFRIFNFYPNCKYLYFSANRHCFYSEASRLLMYLFCLSKAMRLARKITYFVIATLVHNFLIFIDNMTILIYKNHDICLDFANHWTIIVLLYSEASHRSTKNEILKPSFPS